MSIFDRSLISAIISELHSSTNLDAQEYRDFIVCVFFVFFVSIHRHDLLTDVHSSSSESILKPSSDDFFSEILAAAERVDMLYESELDLKRTIEHLVVRAGDINAAAFKSTCFKLYDLVLNSELLAGDYFEYIIQDFSETQGRRASEAYTPRALVEMMVDLVAPTGGESIYDPVCGSGGFLISANDKALRAKGGSPLDIHGSEINLSAARIAKMNCIVHGIHGSDIRIADSLQTFEVSAYDIVLAHPPFSLATDSYERNSSCSYLDFGVPSPNNADFAFLQMIIKSLNSGGRAAILVSNGVLFRGGIEGAIREKIIQAGLVESVISLPGGMLRNTGIPTSILVLKKPGAPGKSILLIDSAEAERQAGTDSFALPKSQFSATIARYKKFEEFEGVAKLVTTDELALNSYSLNISRYMLGKQVEKTSLPDLISKQTQLENSLADLQKGFSELLDRGVTIAN